MTARKKKKNWKKINRVRKCEQAIDEMVKDANSQILLDGDEVTRFAKYFEQVLNVKIFITANANVVGDKRVTG